MSRIVTFFFFVRNGPKANSYAIGLGDQKGRFPIHNFFDGMCLDTFLIVSRIEFVAFVGFGALSGGV